MERRAGAAAVAGQGTSDHFLDHPEERNNDGCPAPFHATPSCRTATPKTAERMLRHPVILRNEACPDPFDTATKCGVARPRELGEARWAHAEIWYASVPAPSGTSTGVTVPFMGGPGDSISEVADIFLALAAGLPERDMLIVDVRGTGRSGRLSCPAVDSALWQPDGQEQVDLVARCAQQIGDRRNDYTTVASVLDVEAIRRALDLPKPSLLGVSYGTWVVQTYTVLFPDLVQSAVIDGIMPFHLDPWSRPFTDAMQRRPPPPLRTDGAMPFRRGRRAGAPRRRQPRRAPGTVPEQHAAADRRSLLGDEHLRRSRTRSPTT